jgi:DNA primase
MKTDDLLGLLQGVKRTSRGWSSRCPSHNDNSPSLSVREAEDGRILLHCFAGCKAQEICEALHIPLRELFGHAERDTVQIRLARAQRVRERREREQVQRLEGVSADAKRDAERLLRSAKDLSIECWSDVFLDTSLNKLADAYGLIGDGNGAE